MSDVGAGPIARADDGVCGAFSIELREGQWLNLLRADCAALNLHGPQPLSVVAWVKRARPAVLLNLIWAVIGLAGFVI